MNADEDLSGWALPEIRDRIDTIDRQIETLLNARAGCAAAVAKVKLSENPEAEFYRPEREAQILDRILKEHTGILPAQEVARIFREIMSACLALEQPLTIAFLGPPGTFTEAAALKHFGHSINSRPMGAIDEVFREVESVAAHYGVVPVENSTEGVVNHTLDSFVNSPLTICGEVELRIHHHLLSEQSDLKNIVKVISHQQSLAQCREWLDRYLPHAERLHASSNAEAVRQVKNKGADYAAIAGDIASELYELPAQVRNIEDEPDNTTRFLIIGRNRPAPSGRDKTSLLLSTPNRPGALYSLLEPFMRHGLSLTRIESRPSRRAMWEYVFFVDIDGHAQDEKVQKAVLDIEKNAGLVKVLGSYPKAVL